MYSTLVFTTSANAHIQQQQINNYIQIYFSYLSKDQYWDVLFAWQWFLCSPFNESIQIQRILGTSAVYSHLEKSEGSPGSLCQCQNLEEHLFAYQQKDTTYSTIKRKRHTPAFYGHAVYTLKSSALACSYTRQPQNVAPQPQTPVAVNAHG